MAADCIYATYYGIVELADCENVLMREIADTRMKRLDVAKTYYLTLLSSECDRVDWRRVNEAIIDRWSRHALEWIKTKAWSGKCFEPRQAVSDKANAEDVGDITNK